MIDEIKKEIQYLVDVDDVPFKQQLINVNWLFKILDSYKDKEKQINATLDTHNEFIDHQNKEIEELKKYYYILKELEERYSVIDLDRNFKEGNKAVDFLLEDIKGLKQKYGI